jgi:PmbA protein
VEDLFIHHLNEQKVKVSGGRIEMVRGKSILRQGVRLFSREGQVFSASAVGAMNKSELFKQAKANGAAGLAEMGCPSSSTKKAYAHLRTQSQRELYPRAKGLALEALDYLQSRLANFVSTGYSISQHIKVGYENSLGADLSSELDNDSLVFELRRRGSANIVDHFFGIYSIEPLDLSAGLGWTCELLSKFDSRVSLSSGKHKVLWSPEGSVLGKLSESLRVDKVAEGSALYGDRLGQKVFSEHLGVEDLRWSPERGVIKPFDYEGSVAPENAKVLISKGVICAGISDLKHERKYGKPSTANGFRSYNSSIQLGFAGLRLSPGQESFRKLLEKEVDPVVVVATAFGGDVTGEGQFSTPVQEAYLWHRGEVQGRLPDLSLNGQLEELLGSDLRAVAADGPEGLTVEPYLLGEASLLVH